MFGGSYFSKSHFSGSYFAPVTFLVFVPKDTDGGGGGGRIVSTTQKINAEFLAKVQREDEELIAIVTVMSKILL